MLTPAYTRRRPRVKVAVAKVVATAAAVTVEAARVVDSSYSRSLSSGGSRAPRKSHMASWTRGPSKMLLRGRSDQNTSVG